MYISILISLALGVLALAFVLYPLFRSRPAEISRSTYAASSCRGTIYE